MEALLVVALLAFVVVVVAAPLRAGASARSERADEAERAVLEARRDAKYREIRDAELDFRTGKLSEPDWRALDRSLRGEAIEILRRLDALGDEAGAGSEPPGTGARGGADADRVARGSGHAAPDAADPPDAAGTAGVGSRASLPDPGGSSGRR